MASRSRLSLSGFLALFLTTFLLSAPAAAFTESYCSTQNTGSGDAFDWEWQSNGKCTDYCNGLGTYAFAVIQYRDCWCSNYIPTKQKQTDVSKCAVDCPGYPGEHCGDISNGLYIYLQLAGTPSGTAGGSQATSSTAAVSTPVPVSSSAQAPTSSKVQTSQKPTSTLQSVQSSAQLQPSVQIITESGAILTRTIYQSSPPNASASTAPIRTGSEDNSPNVGAIVGGVVGGVLGLLAIVGGLLFFLWRRRKQQRDAYNGNPAGIGGSSSGITRNTSTMSKAGLMGGLSDNTSHYPPPIVTNVSSTQNSRYGDHESISPISNRRNSQPLMIDSRLNPNAVITFAQANASRDSFASMDDSRDYGRQLNVRNPDVH